MKHSSIWGHYNIVRCTRVRNKTLNSDKFMEQFEKWSHLYFRNFTRTKYSALFYVSKYYHTALTGISFSCLTKVQCLNLSCVVIHCPCTYGARTLSPQNTRNCRLDIYVCTWALIINSISLLKYLIKKEDLSRLGATFNAFLQTMRVCKLVTATHRTIPEVHKTPK